MKYISFNNIFYNLNKVKEVKFFVDAQSFKISFNGITKYAFRFKDENELYKIRDMMIIDFEKFMESPTLKTFFVSRQIFEKIVDETNLKISDLWEYESYY